MHFNFLAVRLLLGLVAFTGLTVFSSPTQASTYYVRTDGGTNVQCTGKANAAYPGSGTGKACAWKNLMEALPPRFDNYPNAAKIKGGDTVIIAAGSYAIGWAAGYEARWGDPCDPAYASGCTLQTVPSGTASQPTRILGAGWDSGCAAPPELWGENGVTQILDLDGTSNVVIACLDLTDHSNCTYNYRPDPAYACDHNWTSYNKGGTPHYGDWAYQGIHAQDSSNVTLQDLNVHGFANTGIHAGRISDWTVTRVKIVGNGNVGWDGDLGGNNHNSSNSGTLMFTDLTVAWNGCQEDWPNLGSYINCYGQNEGGYGDGLGTAWTGGDWTFIRPKFYKNTSDGLDLLYANGTGSITVDSGYFAQNAGNDIKTSGPATITNNVIIAYCSWFKDAGYPAGGTSCRAGGGELSDMTAPGQKVVFAYNTMIGNPNGMFGGDPTPSSGGTQPLDKSNVYEIYNNIFIGNTSYLKNPSLPFLFWFGDPPNNPATVNLAGNLVWHIQEVSLFNCKTSGITCKDPSLANESMSSFDPVPLPSSPAIDNASAKYVVAYDQTGTPRPLGGGYDIGAIEYRGQPWLTVDKPPVPAGSGGSKAVGAQPSERAQGRPDGNHQPNGFAGGLRTAGTSRYQPTLRRDFPDAAVVQRMVQGTNAAVQPQALSHKHHPVARSAEGAVTHPPAGRGKSSIRTASASTDGADVQARSYFQIVAEWVRDAFQRIARR